MAIAFADRAGVIGYADHSGPSPDGTLGFAVYWDRKTLTQIVSALAVYDQNHTTLIVPGADAIDNWDAIDAILAFRRLVDNQLPHPDAVNAGASRPP